MRDGPDLTDAKVVDVLDRPQVVDRLKNRRAEAPVDRIVDLISGHDDLAF